MILKITKKIRIEQSSPTSNQTNQKKFKTAQKIEYSYQIFVNISTKKNILKLKKGKISDYPYCYELNPYKRIDPERAEYLPL